MTALDPYRTLGLAPGASLDEVKRAYRRLAKQAHPDTAGSAGTARFLALQQAYEAIVRGGGRRLVGGRPRGTGSRPSPGQRPGAGQRPGGAPGAESWQGSDPRQGARTRANASGSRANTGRRNGAGASRPPHERPRARLGTTTYDGADVDSAAGWHGGSWYGVSSGEYWTINPREYADPRKHGPEYLARARRPLAASGATATEAGAAGTETRADAWAEAVRPAAATSMAAETAPPRRPGLLRRLTGRLRRG